MAEARGITKKISQKQCRYCVFAVVTVTTCYFPFSPVFDECNVSLFSFSQTLFSELAVEVLGSFFEHSPDSIACNN